MYKTCHLLDNHIWISASCDQGLKERPRVSGMEGNNGRDCKEKLFTMAAYHLQNMSLVKTKYRRAINYFRRITTFLIATFASSPSASLLPSTFILRWIYLYSAKATFSIHRSHYQDTSLVDIIQSTLEILLKMIVTRYITS
jgi:hypothetical protein